MSMSLALSTYVLFISLMHSVNGAQFTFLFLLSGAGTVSVFVTVIVPLTSVNASI